MSEDAARSAGYIGNVISQQYWVAWNISEFENVLKDWTSDINEYFSAVERMFHIASYGSTL